MNETPLFYVYNYNDTDRAFWKEHLEAWIPDEITDSHIHIIDPSYQIYPISEEMRRSYWVMELMEMQNSATAQHCIKTVYPGRKVQCLAFASPSLDWDIAGSNQYITKEMQMLGWHSLVLVCPQWTSEYLDKLLDQPGVLGVKPYYQLIGRDTQQRDKYLESSIFDYLPRHHLEVLNDRGSWVTLHVPHAGRLGHPDNIRELREIRRRYPNVVVVIAHLGRSYTLPHAMEGLAPFADDPGIYFDNSAVLNPDVHRYALQVIGPKRILYGTDNPIFYLRGRRQWHGTTYINRTSVSLHFNKDRESPEIEATYTLYMYEALRAMKYACEQEHISDEQVRDLFHRNAQELIAHVEHRSVHLQTR